MAKYSEIEVLAQRVGLMNQQLVSKYLDLGMLLEAKQLMAEDVELMELFGWKAGFNPNQPRVPAGNPDGGQWTSGGSSSGTARARAYSTPKVGKSLVTKDPRTGKIPERVNIFIGGALDQNDHGNVGKSSSLHKDVYGRNYYFTHTDAKDVEKLLTTIPQFMEINIIGHSLGGATAAQVALNNPNRITKLVTVDPVGPINVGRDPKIHTPIYERPSYRKVRDSVATWVNINALGVSGGSSGGQIIAGADSWDNDPQGYPNLHIEAPLNHEYFDDILNYRPINSSRTPLQILNTGN